MDFVRDHTIEETCFVPVDVQELFCNPGFRSWKKYFQPWIATERTKTVAHKIGTIAPEFNRMGMDVAWLYYTDDYNAKKLFRLAGGLYGVNPMPEDAIIPKTESAPFDDFETPFESWLLDNNKRHIMLAGVNLTACVYWTAAMAAIKGYKVSVIADLTANGQRRKGARTTHQQDLDSFAKVIGESDKRISDNIQWTLTEQSLDILHTKKSAMALTF